MLELFERSLLSGCADDKALRAKSFPHIGSRH